jgi:hypothetical protein
MRGRAGGVGENEAATGGVTGEEREWDRFVSSERLGYTRGFVPLSRWRHTVRVGAVQHRASRGKLGKIKTPFDSSREHRTEEEGKGEGGSTCEVQPENTRTTRWQRRRTKSVARSIVALGTAPLPEAGLKRR